MKYIIPFIFCSMCAADLELYGFGKSYHTNRDVNWNEKNYGLGLGVAENLDSNFYVTAMIGSYKDSYNEYAKMALIGFRGMLGNPSEFHTIVGVSAGYYDGSSNKGFGIVPYIGFGYDWVDVCVTASPSKENNTAVCSYSNDPQDNRNVSSGVICAFLKLRIMKF